MHLVERDKELSVLYELLEQAARGDGGGCALISGGAGCGKTELLGALGDRAADMGFLVLSATGTWAERQLPGSLLGQLARHPDAPFRGDRLPGAPLEPTGAAEASGPVRNARLDDLDPGTAVFLHRASTELLAAAERTPVLVCLDDAHFVDAASVHWLLHLLRGLRSSRVVVALTECRRQAANPLLHAELLRQPNYRYLRAEALSEEGAARILTAQGVLPLPEGEEASRRLTAEYHRTSQGNPLLLRALVEDSRAAPRAGGAVVGNAFVDVVLSWIQRGDPTLLRMVQMLAVLHEEDDPLALTARMLGGDAGHVVDSYMCGLGSVGLLDGVRLRLPEVREAVLGTLSAGEHSELHLRAARLLFEEGAPATSVARHLLAADRDPEPWASVVLYNAAQRLFAANRLSEACACLETALRICTDDTERITMKLLLIRVAWLYNPALGRRHITDLALARKQGRLPVRHTMPLAENMLWLGLHDEAADILETFTRSADGAGAPTEAEIRLSRELIFSSYPSLSARVAGEPEQDRQAPWPWGGATGDVRVLAMSALSYTLAHGPNASVTADAEAAMRAMRLGDETFVPIKGAVAALLFADRLEEAARWCDQWLEKVRERDIPMWEAHLLSMRAEIALRLGDVRLARRLAERALERVPAEGWGTVAAIPLSTAVYAATEAGDYAAAAAWLEVPLPEKAFDSRFGLMYLYARGRYHLETGQPHAALNDFSICGASMAAWGFDHPSVVPWRSDAAQAYLQLGNTDKAAELARQQMSLIGGDRLRSRGMALRALALTGRPAEGVDLLAEAVDIFRACGDRLQLARALADLGRLHHRAGRPGRAQPVLRLAARLARECGAEPLLRALPVMRPASAPAAPASTGPASTAPAQRRGSAVPAPERPPRGGQLAAVRLSGAERRVAALAARGHTNREISGRLRITVSTVEQHLTRVYRKLDITSREGIPDEILLEPARE